MCVCVCVCACLFLFCFVYFVCLVFLFCFVCFLLVCCCLLVSFSFLFLSSFLLFFSSFQRGRRFPIAVASLTRETPVTQTQAPSLGRKFDQDRLLSARHCNNSSPTGWSCRPLAVGEAATPCRMVHRDAVMIYTERPAGKRSARCALTPALSGHLRSGPPRAVGPCQGAMESGGGGFRLVTTFRFCRFFLFLGGGGGGPCAVSAFGALILSCCVFFVPFYFNFISSPSSQNKIDCY